MAIFKERLPQRDVMLAVFVACMVPIHLWSIFNVLREVPAWIISMNLWEMAGVIAYTQAFALLETLLIVSIFVVVAFVLPGKWFRDDLVVTSTAIMFVLTIWLIILHYNSAWIEDRNARALALWGVTFLVALVVLIGFSRKWEAADSISMQVISRLSILAVLYLAIDLVSVLIIAIRNVSF